jgi:predicted  nucleic acid-binding Zn-ribbon protein
MSDAVFEMIARLEERLIEKEKENAVLQERISRLQTATNLNVVQQKLDNFIAEIHTLHNAKIASFKDLVNELNQEGVRRYEGAVKLVNENCDKNSQKIIKLLGQHE